MKRRIEELESLVKNNEITTQEMESELENMIFFSHVFGIDQAAAVEILDTAGYNYITDRF